MHLYLHPANRDVYLVSLQLPQNMYHATKLHHPALKRELKHIQGESKYATYGVRLQRRPSLKKAGRAQAIKILGDQIGKEIIDLPSRQINDPLLGKHYSLLFLSNSLVTVSEPTRAF